MPKTKQMTLEYSEWGGARDGSGRKRTSKRARVPHRARPRMTKHTPAHVTLRLASGLPTLRQGRSHRTLFDALAAAADRGGLRILHYSAQSNHVHLVCEADDARTLSRCLQGLCVRIAHALNSLWGRAGKVFEDRFHTRPLATPRELRNTLVYVFGNAHHHGIHVTGGIDPYSSASSFDGWKRRSPALAVVLRYSPFPRAQSWLMRDGWRKRGLLDPLG